MLLEPLLAAAATLSATGSTSPRPDASILLGVRLTSFVTLSPAPELFLTSPSRRDAAGAAAGGGRDALSYGVSFATTRSHQLARGAPAWFLSGISGWFSLSLGAWVPKNLARRRRDAARPDRAAWAVQRLPRRSQLPGQRQHEPLGSSHLGSSGVGSLL